MAQTSTIKAGRSSRIRRRRSQLRVDSGVFGGPGCACPRRHATAIRHTARASKPRPPYDQAGPRVYGLQVGQSRLAFRRARTCRRHLHSAARPLRRLLPGAFCLGNHGYQDIRPGQPYSLGRGTIVLRLCNHRCGAPFALSRTSGIYRWPCVGRSRASAVHHGRVPISSSPARGRCQTNTDPSLLPQDSASNPRSAGAPTSRWMLFARRSREQGLGRRLTCHSNSLYGGYRDAVQSRSTSGHRQTVWISLARRLC